jgi:hypothetical protein
MLHAVVLHFHPRQEMPQQHDASKVLDQQGET